jgi:hypothetical protein
VKVIRTTAKVDIGSDRLYLKKRVENDENEAIVPCRK